MTNVWAIAMVKDEADIIESTVRGMLDEVDVVLVADNGSTDGTRILLDSMAARWNGRLLVRDDPEVGYFQSRKMTALASIAGDHGASWVVPFDADEVWFSKFGRIADVLEALPPVEGIARAALYDHVTTDQDDLTILDPTERIRWRRQKPAELPKVAARPVARVIIEQGNHGAHYPDMAPHPVMEIRHFPYRSPEQFVRKVANGAAAYAATDLPDHAGAHWRGYGAILRDSGPEVLVREVYRRWFHQADPLQPTPGGDLLVYDPAR